MFKKILFLTLLFLVACEASSENSPSKTSKLSVEISLADAIQRGYNVDSISLTLTNSDKSFESNYPIENDVFSTEFIDLPVGTYTLEVKLFEDWLLVADGFSSVTITSQTTNSIALLINYKEVLRYEDNAAATQNIIFYASDNQIYLHNKNTTISQPVTVGKYAFWLKPDDIYAYNTSDHQSLVFKNIDGRELKRYNISQNVGTLEFPVYAKYSNKIFFHKRYSSTNYDIASMDLYSGEIEVFEHPSIFGNPVGNEADDWIYFFEIVSGTATSIHRMKSDGSSLGHVISAGASSRFSNFGMSRNGKFLSLVKVTNGSTYHIIKVDTETKTESLIFDATSLGSAANAQVSNDQQKVYFYSNGDIYEVYLDGTGLNKIIELNGINAFRALDW